MAEKGIRLTNRAAEMTLDYWHKNIIPNYLFGTLNGFLELLHSPKSRM